MVLCFFSSSLFLGPNFAVSSAAAFCPSLVLMMAFWNAMIPTFDGGYESEVCGGAPVWAWDSSAAPRAMAGRKTKFFVKLKLLEFVSILTYCNKCAPSAGLYVGSSSTVKTTSSHGAKSILANAEHAVQRGGVGTV